MKILEKIKTILGSKVNKYTLYVGLTDKDVRKQKVTTKEAKQIITNALANNGIDGATFLGAQGIYTYVTGETESENSFKIEVLFAKDKQVKSAIEEIKEKLNQETVALVKEKIQSSLI